MQLHFLSAMSHVRAVQLSTCQFAANSCRQHRASVADSWPIHRRALVWPGSSASGANSRVQPSCGLSLTLWTLANVNYRLHSSTACLPCSCHPSAINRSMTCPAHLATARGVAILHSTARACSSTAHGRHSTSTSTLQPCTAALQFAAPRRQQRQRQVGRCAVAALNYGADVSWRSALLTGCANASRSRITCSQNCATHRT